MITSIPPGIVIDVRVIPRARRAGVAGTRGDALLVRVTAPPVEGAANAELIAIVAGALGVPRREVTIVAGESRRLKRVRVSGMTADAARALLSAQPCPR